MTRRNRVPYPVWEQMWQIFFPWVTGDEGAQTSSQGPTPVSKARRQRRKRLTTLVLAAVTGLFLVAQDARAVDASYMTIALNKSVDTPRENYPSIFRSHETRYTNLTPFTKWSGVLARFAKEFDGSMKQKTTRKWLSFLEDTRSLDKSDQIEAVNTYMNKIKFISDDDNYGTSDYWATPMEFLKRGGDCEDYAIAKYVSLRALGFDENQMRIAIVFDTHLNMPHAVLVVYQDDEALVLDNQSPDVKDAASIRQYTPIYSINQLAWWRH